VIDEHNRKEDAVQGIEHSEPRRRTCKRAILDSQWAIAQFFQQNAKLKNEALLLASHYYMNLNLKHRMKDFYGMHGNK